ncbi:hypothetical protein MNBD_GAMMA19-1177 [hydrothermal vent metagenome]|uniref:Uncharacterized protein n=1 Tax=hydrothermal vent metagenome TaxID=652676 RepID=A0A3B1AVP8_9ZZZZ
MNRQSQKQGGLVCHRCCEVCVIDSTERRINEMAECDYQVSVDRLKKTGKQKTQPETLSLVIPGWVKVSIGIDAEYISSNFVCVPPQNVRIAISLF